MSDTETQEQTTNIVVPPEDQPSEDGAPVTHHVDPATAETATPPAGSMHDDEAAPAAPSTPKERAKASDLEGDLRRVLDDYVSGALVLPEGTLPTPHALAAQIATRRADGHPVSSGAVSAALARWKEIGFATLGSKPTTFIDYTDAARAEGLAALKAKHRASISTARKAVTEPATKPIVEPAVVSAPVTPEASVPSPAVAPESTPSAPETQSWESGYPVQEVPAPAVQEAPQPSGDTPF